MEIIAFNQLHMKSMKFVVPLHFISRKKKSPNDAVTPQRQSQFTPMMFAFIFGVN